MRYGDYVFSMEQKKSRLDRRRSFAGGGHACFWRKDRGGGAADQSTVKSEKIAGETEQQRQAFIRSFGWEIEEEPLTVMEVKIPDEFDAVYEEYNTLQKTQGMDLSKLKGKRCKKYQYAVLNYPDRPEYVTCTLLVRDGKIVGGDISCAGEDGFTHGFSLPA